MPDVGAVPSGESGRALLARALHPLVRALVAAHVSPNAITAASLVAGGVAGASVATGHLGLGAGALVAASLGDALDGLVARQSGTASVAGALFDSAVDRYEEAMVLSGLAFLFRASPVLFALSLLALVGSFMVSYGSAKAEALRVPVPGGVMRRAERAACMCLGLALTPGAEVLVRQHALAPSLSYLPVAVALGVVAVASNVSGVSRLRRIAADASARSSPE